MEVGMTPTGTHMNGEKWGTEIHRSLAFEHVTYAGYHLLVLGNALQPQHKLSTVEAVLIASFCKVFPNLFKLDNSQLHKAWQVSFVFALKILVVYSGPSSFSL